RAERQPSIGFRAVRDRRPGRRRPDRRGASPVTDAPTLPFRRSEDDRVLAGVCGGVASALAVDATLVRLAFALLALAGGAGILLYLAALTYCGRTPWIGQLLIAVSAIAFLLALGLSGV